MTETGHLEMQKGKTHIPDSLKLTNRFQSRVQKESFPFLQIVSTSPTTLTL